jgi:uncharacterized membrane protein YuzA (DUF378 family)
MGGKGDKKGKHSMVEKAVANLIKLVMGVSALLSYVLVGLLTIAGIMMCAFLKIRVDKYHRRKRWVKF